MLILVGKAGVGKTAVREELAERLSLRSLGPDDFPGRWRDVYAELNDSCILECCQIPAAVRQRMNGATIVELVAPDSVRHQRLKQQGLSSLDIARRLVENRNGSLGYEERIEPTMIVETTEPPAVVAERIVKRL